VYLTQNKSSDVKKELRQKAKEKDATDKAKTKANTSKMYNSKPMPRIKNDENHQNRFAQESS
jgi:hypothetical protein